MKGSETSIPADAHEERNSSAASPTMTPEELKSAYSAPAHVPEHEKSPSVLFSLGAQIRDKISQALPSPSEKLEQMKQAFRSTLLSIPVLKQVVRYYESYTDKLKNAFEAKSSEDQGSETFQAQNSPEPSPETLTGKSEASAKAYLKAEEAERNHMNAMEHDFIEIHHQYRKQLKHNHGELKIDRPVLEISNQGENNLQDLARSIAKKQSQQGFVAHTTDDFRKEKHIDGEIIMSGFSSAREAFDGFLKSKKNHYHYITGNFFEMAPAISCGIEEKTGKKTYTLVVLYRNGNAQSQKPPVIDIPGNTETVDIDSSSLEGCIAGREHLKKHFEALDADLESVEGITYKINSGETEKLQKSPTTRGAFVITLQKGEQSELYMVFDAPPILKRVLEIDGKQKVTEVPFHLLVEDFQKLNNKTTPSADDLQEQYDQSDNEQEESSQEEPLP